MIVIELEEFITLCNDSPIIPYCNIKDDKSSYSDSSGKNIYSYSEKFNRELFRCLVSENGNNFITRKDLNKLLNGLYYHKIINADYRAQLAIDILETLNYFIGSSIKKFNEFNNTLWEKAISLLKGYNEYKKDRDKGLFPNKAIQRAEAAVKMRNLGAVVYVKNNEICFDNIKSVFKFMAARIENMGGIWFIEALLSTISFDKDSGRFILPKSSNRADIQTLPDINIPFNYMLNSGLNKISSVGYCEFQNKKYFDDTLKYFQTICFALLTVQSYSIWEDILYKDKSPLEYLKDLVFRESVFDLHQCSSRFAIKLFEFINKSEKTNLYGKKINDIINFLEWILSKAIQGKFKQVNLNELKKRKFTNLSIEKILESTSMNSYDFNQGFESPLDYEHVNYWNYPLIKTDEKNYLILPKPIAARCCIEALLSFLRNIDNNFDGKIGTIMEEFLKYEFLKKGIKVEGGYYNVFINNDNGVKEEISGECDGIIETKKNIFLFEMKKKSLVRASRSGSEFNILTDLGGSLLDSQIQTLRTEYLLSKTDLNLTSKNSNYILKQNARVCERITITLFPFGDLQDRVLVEKILEILSNNKFKYLVDDETKLSGEQLKKFKEDKKKLEKLSNKQDLLVHYVKLLNVKRPFFNSWFLDLEKILWILKNVKNLNDFSEKLLQTKYVVIGTHDFFLENKARTILC